jgi:hypothetical protein
LNRETASGRTIAEALRLHAATAAAETLSFPPGLVRFKRSDVAVAHQEAPDLTAIADLVCELNGITPELLGHRIRAVRRVPHRARETAFGRIPPMSRLPAHSHSRAGADGLRLACISRCPVTSSAASPGVRDEYRRLRPGQLRGRFRRRISAPARPRHVPEPPPTAFGALFQPSAPACRGGMLSRPELLGQPGRCTRVTISVAGPNLAVSVLCAADGVA